MSTSEERAQAAQDAQAAMEERVARSNTMKEQGYSNREIADSLGLSESSVRTLLKPINWGYNCLTTGVHHGRPEQMWNLPLHQALMMFQEDGIKQLVVARIRTDALIFVHRGNEPKPTIEWANRTAELAEERFAKLFTAKLDEIAEYYASASWKLDIQDVIERVKDNKLNPHYKPLHGHDSINMICRILGVQCSIQASKSTD